MKSRPIKIRLFLFGIAVAFAGCAHKSEIHSGGCNEGPSPRMIEIAIVRYAGEMDFPPLLKIVPIEVINRGNAPRDPEASRIFPLARLGGSPVASSQQ